MDSIGISYNVHCCFVSQKLNFNIKTQKHYCDNHNRTVFFVITKKILLSINFFAT